MILVIKLLSRIFISSEFTDTVRPVMGHIEIDVPTLGAEALDSCPRSANSLSHFR